MFRLWSCVIFIASLLTHQQMGSNNRDTTNRPHYFHSHSKIFSSPTYLVSKLTPKYGSGQDRHTYSKVAVGKKRQSGVEFQSRREWEKEERESGRERRDLRWLSVRADGYE